MRTPFTIEHIRKSAVAKLNPHIMEGKGKKKAKYNNVKVVFDGITFDSQKECNRYINLRALQSAGEITDLQVHVSFRLESNDIKLCSYEADFVYKNKQGELVVEDVKSSITKRLAVYRMKKKMMLAQYKIEIKEV